MPIGNLATSKPRKAYHCCVFNLYNFNLYNDIRLTRGAGTPCQRPDSGLY
ncbi:hypothetical protein L829_2714 [Mycobacteroides abscessus MAB_030201_1075]|uniref:Uncharacterized protein n=1 Tax=Mycobacteroides abscessus MAB_030201_1075 TaxID=1335410 RepID=A0A829PPL1_9MYCO|nr:hypothetical protein L829_2714 [Mycobacteroides abscessus MAB_030201_1075]